jgi:signal transduction histidine kinase
MTNDAPSPEAEQIRRLERRLDRERRARAEAEQIAEQGLRSLYDANQELDQRIIKRTEQLQQALERAEAANDAKSTFLAQMSHQINTPLNGLMGMLELLSAEVRDPQSQEWHAAALRSANRLQRITSRLTIYVSLDGADLRTNAPTLALRSVLSSAHDRWHADCLRAGQLLTVDLTTTNELPVAAPIELDMLLDELLSNAVNHGGPGSVVLSGRQDETGNAVIELADAGSGIDPARVQALRDIDGDAELTQRADAEVNLGLALVDRIVQSLGGTWSLSLESQPAVSVTLPLASG